MPKQTPKQARLSTAKKVAGLLPQKTERGGETVVPDALLRKIIKDLEK
jgi:hypothetical protein